MPIDYSKIKLTVCMSVHNTAHLLKRSLKTYMKQTMPKEQWMLIICNDNSDDDVWSVVEPYVDLMNIEYIHLRHHDGMRGGMRAFNIMYKMAQSEIIAELTPEGLLPPNVFQKMYDLHFEERDGIKHEIHNRFVTFKSYRFTRELQLKLDTVDWEMDLLNINLLPEFENDWVLQNVEKTAFRTHEFSSYRRKDFFNLYGEMGFVAYTDYGSCDPGFSGMRENNGWEDYVVMDTMIYHEFHPPWHFKASHYPQKYQNKWAHSTSNLYGDPRIPQGGTCEIWDGGSHEWYSEKEIQEYRDMEKDVYETGYPVLKNTIHD